MINKCRIMAVAMMTALISANLTSCNNEEVILDEPKGDEYVTVKLGCAGEFLDITTSPMSRAGDGDLLLLQIVNLEKYEDNYYNETWYEERDNYAYAVLNYSEEIAVNLLKGRPYRIKASVITGGVNSYQLYEDITLGEIVYTSYGNVYANRVENGQYEFDRFYGQTDIDATEDSEITIDTKRVSYQVQLIASELKDGESLEIKVTRNQDDFNSYYGDYNVVLDSKNLDNTRILTFEDINDAWSHAMDNREYEEDKYLAITWHKAIDSGDGTISTEEVNMGTYKVSFKRNTKTSITIVPEDLNTENTLKITCSDVWETTTHTIQGGQLQ